MLGRYVCHISMEISVRSILIQPGLVLNLLWSPSPKRQRKLRINPRENILHCCWITYLAIFQLTILLSRRSLSLAWISLRSKSVKCLALLAKSCPSNKYASYGFHFSVCPKRSHFWWLKGRTRTVRCCTLINEIKLFGPLPGYIRLDIRLNNQASYSLPVLY